MGLMVVGLGALGVSIVYLLNPGNLNVLTGFSLGASSIALFCRVGATASAATNTASTMYWRRR